MKIVKYVLYAIMMLSVSGQVSAQESVKGSVIAKDTILIGDQIKWSIKLPSSSLKDAVEIMAADKGGEIVKGVEIVGGVVLDTLSLKNGVPEIEASALITSFDSGSYQLPPFPLFIRTKDGSVDTVDTGAPVLEVTTIAIDTTSFKPYDIKGQMTYPITFMDVLPWILGVLAVLLLAYLIFRYVRYLKAKKDGLVQDGPADPPHIIALRELDRVRMSKMWQDGKQKEYYTAITDILRLYLEGRYSIQAMEKTSKEILDELSDKKMTSEQFSELSELFNLSDLVKFAKYTASEHENENAIPVAVRFVNSTFEETLEAEKRG